MKCCPDYCETCHEHHSGDLCPSYEVRTTGQNLTRQRIVHLESRLEKSLVEIERLQMERDELRDASGCPPDCNLLSWVRSLSDFFDKHAEESQAAHAEIERLRIEVSRWRDTADRLPQYAICKVESVLEAKDERSGRVPAPPPT